MPSPRDWARQASIPPKVSLELRFPQMVDPVREILEEMADTEGCVVTMAQMWAYLQAPEPDGCGLVPGETLTPDYQSFRNYVTRRHNDLWALRGGKRAQREAADG